VPRSFIRKRIVQSGLAALVLASGASVDAQVLPSDPLVFGDGRVTVSGGASLTVSCADSTPETCGNDAGFFNYSDYEHSTLRMLRLTVNASVRANRYLSVLTEVRSENRDHPVPYALYVRFKPWPKRAIDIQAGRIPPVFGAFPRRDYSSDNVLIGYPLAYQYLSSLRSDALPASADELLRMRGSGWTATRPATCLPSLSSLTRGLASDPVVNATAASSHSD
jgi:hypothetical protein